MENWSRHLQHKPKKLQVCIKDENCIKVKVKDIAPPAEYIKVKVTCKQHHIMN